ncbi:MAG: prolipoprotein diacylglyceryl transferase [Bacillota bacterium]|jgi:phosphatidylglycerol:prolipoprotein diacylglycerol transferase|nr:prolipoprotein diacylglyceryl transferase [Bacillota bacterium]MDI9415456.1 prolipoprotein diacylglyceryl transferase [Bacillota bacterium]NLD12814.1 prolipoprotein diacylglyceryl transferase [Bacillota bacterium]HAV20840.1 prolipoprotein diacylglyceryl transferase [Bacillota bacterium]HCD41408.1 prolipoprotein diacylglyceryl transferase [Bacillota bacterium]
MRPILFQIGRIPILSYGFSLAIAFVLCTILGIREAKRRGIDPEKVFDLALYVCISAIIGARLLFVLLDIPTYFKDPVQIFNLRDGGLAYHGGFIAALIVGIAYARRSRLNAWVMADIIAPLIALGYAIVRIGCLLNGCCFGLPSDAPWALACRAGDSTLRHPTQLYAALLSLVIFIILYANRDHKRFPGYLMFLYVGLYSVSRFIVEIFRDVPRLIGPLSVTQLASILLVFGAFASIYVLSSEPVERQSAAGQQ